MNITQQQSDALVALAQGSYGSIDLVIAEFSDTGLAVKLDTIQPGAFLIAEDAYSYSIKYIGYDFRLEDVEIGEPEAPTQWPQFPGVTIIDEIEVVKEEDK